MGADGGRGNEESPHVRKKEREQEVHLNTEKCQRILGAASPVEKTKNSTPAAAPRKEGCDE